MDAVLTNCRDQIDLHGWTIVSVLESQGLAQPSFSYTVGLTRVGSPELIIFGSCPYCAAEVLDALAARLLAGEVLVDGDQVVPPVQPGHVLMVRSLPAQVVAEHLFVAAQLFPDAVFGIRALQVVWTDENGRWPWDCDVDPHVAAVQQFWTAR